MPVPIVPTSRGSEGNRVWLPTCSATSWSMEIVFLKLLAVGCGAPLRKVRVERWPSELSRWERPLKTVIRLRWAAMMSR